MVDKLKNVVDRSGSTLLAQWWTFYRQYFQNDSECLNFIYSTIKDEPIVNVPYHEVEPGIYESKDGRRIYDKDFVPKRMLNNVMRMVSAARDMEQIRRGKDVFKIVFLVTCVETLQKLSGKDEQKKDMLFDFFETFTSKDDKKYIANRFAHDDEEQIDSNSQENSFQQFVGVINEYRNCAAHEGDYWNYCFNNNSDKDEYPVLLVVKIDLEKYSRKNKKEHCFRTQISYHEFEDIFVRTCIAYITRYVASQNEGK